MALINLIHWIHKSKPQLLCVNTSFSSLTCKYCITYLIATYFVGMFAYEELWSSKDKEMASTCIFGTKEACRLGMSIIEALSGV